MIVPMKKITLLCLASDRAGALEKLQALGVMHLTSRVTGEAGDRQSVKLKMEEFRRLIGILSEREKGTRETSLELSGRELADYARTVVNGRDELNKALAEIETEIETLAAWGDFDRSQLDELAKQGVHVYLCESAAADLEKWRAAADVEYIEELWWRDNKVGYAVLSLADLSGRDLPLAYLPERRLAVLDKKRREYQRMIIAIEHDMDELVATLPKLHEYLTALETEHDFLEARDSMESVGEVALLHGFIPAPQEKLLTEAAMADGWALSISDPGPDDRVPTLIKLGKWTKVVKPLFDFLGILPGYTELDVSPGVLVFFSIFFGMIINDAGYGLLFLTVTLFARWKFRNNPAARLPLAFMTVQSIAAIVWGALAGSYFGVPFGGIAWLTDQSTSNQHVQLVCFVLGLSQLVLGRLWQATQEPSWRKRLGHIGWALVLGGNFLIVLSLLKCAELPEWASTTLMYSLYGSGLLLVVIGAVNWTSIGDVFQFPFSIIGSFVDILSYIRLFAVGLAGYYIALNFNAMGVGLAKSSWMLWLPGVVVLFFGHALNISLCMMSVLVHGVRLNTLEFSNHAGLTWSGVAYKPLQRSDAGIEEQV